jgi:hypothetical protein
MKTEQWNYEQRKKGAEGEQLLDLELKVVAPNRCFVLSCLNQHPVLSDLPTNTQILSKYANTEK